MSLNLSKLQNVTKLTNGEIQAQCPACSAVGLDTKGEHLKIFADGKYACAANQGDKEHRKEIFKLAGSSTERQAYCGKLSVNPFVAPPCTVLVDLAHMSRFTRKQTRPNEVDAAGDNDKEATAA